MKNAKLTKRIKLFHFESASDYEIQLIRERDDKKNINFVFIDENCCQRLRF